MILTGDERKREKIKAMVIICGVLIAIMLIVIAAVLLIHGFHDFIRP